MAISLRTFNGSTWDAFDLDAYGFAKPVVDIGYGPAKFTFLIHAAQHTQPIPLRTLVSFEDDDYSGDPDRPVFLGHVYQIVPQGSNELQYVCYDVTMRARNEITILSGPHGDSTSIPRLVYNTKIDNDDDYVFSVALDSEVGEIIEDILTNAYNELLTNCSAAPLTGGADAFDSSDLSPLDFEPQDKIVFESEQLGQGIDRLLGEHYPNYRMIFEPGFTASLNKWRFVDPTAGDQVTLTLNEFGSNKHVMSFTITPEIGQRYTAVKIYGPQAITTATVSVSGGGLTEDWNGTQESNFLASGPALGAASVGNCARKWQITDTTKRNMARYLPDEELVDDAQYSINGESYLERRIREPTLQVTWDDTNWYTIGGIKIDYRTGEIEAPIAIYRYEPDGSPVYEIPSDVRLIYAYFGSPVTVRKPASGYEGTAYDDAGMEVEERIYDEMLAVGYEKGTPVVLATRTAQYEKLAQSRLDGRKDIVWAGGCTLAGIDYDFILLQKLISFAAVDGDGDTITTGWESIDAILTNVEYDYEQDLTTLTFSSDVLAFMNVDVADLKRRLKIHALQTLRITNTFLDSANGQITTGVQFRNLLVDFESNPFGDIVGEY